MTILSIETSCDETAAAVTEGRRVLGNAIYSQVLIHKKWGGVVPSLAKRAHEERIDLIIEDALNKSRKNWKNIDAIAVTYGPGLAIALEVGILKAKELAKRYKKPIIPVNHMEGHMYACFAQNSAGNPQRDLIFPYLAFLISGGHTELVIFKNHGSYEIIGETVDDAAGEALDKAAKMLGLGYPGGPVIERLAKEVGNKDTYHFPRPMMRSKDLNFSFSGLKTSLYYSLKNLKEREKSKNLKLILSSFQEAVFESLLVKLDKAVEKTKINKVITGGGVIANQRLRTLLRNLVKKHNGQVIFPPYKNLCTDNAAMIGVAAYFNAKNKIFGKDFQKLDRVPRLRLG